MLYLHRVLNKIPHRIYMPWFIKKTLHHRCLTGLRIFLRLQMWQGSKYVRVTQGSEQNATLYRYLIRP